MALDPTGTIGKLPCEINLNLILAEKNDSQLTKQITKLLVKVRTCLKQLRHVPDLPARSYFCGLLRKDAEASIERITGSPVRGVPVKDVVASHTMCCIHAYFAREKC